MGCTMGCNSFKTACDNDHDDCQGRWHFVLFTKSWDEGSEKVLMILESPENATLSIS